MLFFNQIFSLRDSHMSLKKLLTGPQLISEFSLLPLPGIKLPLKRCRSVSNLISHVLKPSGLSMAIRTSLNKTIFNAA